MSQITANTSVAEIVKLCPGARRIFDEHGLKGCGGEHGSKRTTGVLCCSPSGQTG